MKSKKTIKAIIFLLILSFSVDALARSRRRRAHVVRKRKTSEVSLMTFNVENLFDTKHDKGKEDYTFLPLEQKRNAAHVERCSKIEVEKWKKQCLEWDWSEKALKTKYQRLTQVLMQVDEGAGPDVVVLQEVENMNVLEAWHKKFLNRMGYLRPILLEGDDERGIDVAMVTKLRVVGMPVLHQIPFTNMDDKRKKDTRGILEVTVALPDGTKLTIFGVHFPAPFNPVELRVQALEYLQKLLEKKGPDQLVMAAGDFNIPSDEDRKEKLLDKFVRPNWLAVQDFCDGCVGTTHYAATKSWSFLDMILFSKNIEKAKWQPDTSSVRVINMAVEQKTKQGYPKSFEMPGATGVSDHWPLTVNLKVSSAVKN